MKKIIIISTVSMSFATLVKGQPKYLSKYYDVTVVTSSSNVNSDISSYEGVEVKSIDMTRKITIVEDLKSLWKLFVYINSKKPDVVYTFTPKAGLLGMIASFLARVPIRIHNVVGMPLMEANGAKAKLLKFVERVTYAFSTRLFCNSFGLKNYINEHLTSKDITVVAQGSINGVDADFFKDTFSDDYKRKQREKFAIKDSDFVITFVGRIVKDKGINELIEAFILLKKEFKGIKLLLVGDYEEHLNPIKASNKLLIDSDDDIISVGFQKDIREFLAISDLFVLPSYREGLPNSLIEAGSFGIPLIATDINGCNEIIIENETGLLVKPKNIDSLKDAIDKMIKDKDLYNHIKSNIRELTLKRYEQKYFWKELRGEIEKSF